MNGNIFSLQNLLHRNKAVYNEILVLLVLLKYWFYWCYLV